MVSLAARLLPFVIQARGAKKRYLDPDRVRQARSRRG